MRRKGVVCRVVVFARHIYVFVFARWKAIICRVIVSPRQIHGFHSMRWKAVICRVIVSAPQIHVWVPWEDNRLLLVYLFSSLTSTFWIQRDAKAGVCRPVTVSSTQTHVLGSAMIDKNPVTRRNPSDSPFRSTVDAFFRSLDKSATRFAPCTISTKGGSMLAARTRRSVKEAFLGTPAFGLRAASRVSCSGGVHIFARVALIFFGVKLWFSNSHVQVRRVL